jgi:hypothetical protein
MSVAYLIDVSGTIPWSEIRNISMKISRRFRPGDFVMIFDVRVWGVPFVGNPTPWDILQTIMSLRTCWQGTDLQAAILCARKKDPNCELVVFSDGELPAVADSYELIKT